MTRIVASGFAAMLLLCFVVLLDVNSYLVRNPPDSPVREVKFYQLAREVYGNSNMTGAQMVKQAKLLRLFKITRDFLQASDVEWWLDFASLLGWYRDGRILDHDYDVDFSMMEDQFNILYKNRRWLHKHGCYWTDRRKDHNGRAKAVVACKWFHREHHSGADIYGFKGNSSIIFPSTFDGCRIGSKNFNLPCASSICPEKRSWYFPLNCSSTNTLHGERICVPHKTHRVLVRYYGSINKKATCRRKCCIGGIENLPANPVQHTPSLPFWHNSGRWEGED